MEFPEKPAVFSIVPTPTVFYIQKLWGFIFQVLGPWAVWSGLAWGWGCSLPRYPSWFLATTCECGTTHSTAAAASLCYIRSPPLSIPTLHLCPLYCLHECGFFKSLVVGLPHSLIFWRFWVLFVLRLVVILLVVVQGGEACLRAPPSWLEVPSQYFLHYASI